MEMVGMGDVGVVRRLFMVARRVRLCRRMVVPGCVLMMRGRAAVVLYLFFVGHGICG